MSQKLSGKNLKRVQTIYYIFISGLGCFGFLTLHFPQDCCKDHTPSIIGDIIIGYKKDFKCQYHLISFRWDDLKKMYIPRIWNVTFSWFESRLWKILISGYQMGS